jgi:hypothetical protein
MADEFIAIAEAATGRTVRSFLSAVHTDADLAAELWLFEPVDERETAVAPEESEDGAGG